MPLEWYFAFRLPGLGQHFGVLDIWTSWCCAAKYMPTQFAARCEGPVGASWGDTQTHDDVIKWKHFPRYWPFVRGIHRSPVTRSFDIFFDLRLNKRLSKQSWCWWYETLSCPLWHHCNALGQNVKWCVNKHSSWWTSKEKQIQCLMPVSMVRGSDKYLLEWKKFY